MWLRIYTPMRIIEILMIKIGLIAGIVVVKVFTKTAALVRALLIFVHACTQNRPLAKHAKVKVVGTSITAQLKGTAPKHKKPAQPNQGLRGF